MTDLSGCKRLSAELINVALKDIKKHPGQSSKYKHAISWLLGNDSEYVFPFQIACEVLDYNPSYLRRSIAEIPEVRAKLTKHQLELLLKE